MKNILVAIDFSDVTESVLGAAEELARAFGANVVLMHCVTESTDITLMGEVVGLLPTALEALPGAYPDDYRRLADMTSGLRDKGIDAELLFVSGLPIDTILTTIEDRKIDLVIMGSHGHGALYELLVGTVTEGVLHRVSCPAMIIPSHRHIVSKVGDVTSNVWNEIPAATPF